MPCDAPFQGDRLCRPVLHYVMVTALRWSRDLAGESPVTHRLIGGDFALRLRGATASRTCPLKYFLSLFYHCLIWRLCSWPLQVILDTVSEYLARDIHPLQSECPREALSADTPVSLAPFAQYFRAPSMTTSPWSRPYSVNAC